MHGTCVVVVLLLYLGKLLIMVSGEVLGYKREAGAYESWIQQLNMFTDVHHKYFPIVVEGSFLSFVFYFGVF